MISSILHNAFNVIAFVVPKALDRWDITDQRAKAMQEMGELIVALTRYREGRGTIDEVIEESADVIIMTLQMVAWHVNVKNDWQGVLGAMLTKKIHRTITKLNESVSDDVSVDSGETSE